MPLPGVVIVPKQTTTVPEDGAHLWGDGFEVETLIHVRVAKAGLEVAEVPSHEYSRIHGESNLNAVRDGLRVVRTILAEWRRSKRARAAQVLRSPALTIEREVVPAEEPVG